MSKTLTIGIGTYGQTRNYIGRTLQSIIALLKKYRYTTKTTIAIYNDDSQYSLDYITALSYQKKYPNLIVCKDNGQNLGIAKTYQKMCFQCQTPYFLQFDSDDIIGDFNIKQQVQFLQDNQEYCGSYGVKIIFNQEGARIGRCGQQYNLTKNKITINNNSLLVRVEDCKKTGFYFPQFYKSDKSFDAALDVMMWIGLILKKPLYFDRTVRTYGLDWQDGNHIKNGGKYGQQFKVLQNMLRHHYGLFSDNWTVYQKQLYYYLWETYLNKEQKKQFWNRIGQQRFQDRCIFVAYLGDLYKQHQYQKMYANMYLGLLKNKQLEIDIVSVLTTSGLIKLYKQSFVEIFNKNVEKFKLNQNVQWFERFVKLK